jgi:hypothetical protein
MRVATFFRQHANSFDLITPPLEKRRAPRSSSHLTTKPTLGTRTNSSSSSLVAGETSSMSDSHKRHSLNLSSTHSPSRSGSSKSTTQNGPTSVGVEIESPPLVFFGQPSSSTGALLSGLLKLTVAEEGMAVESIKMKLVVDVKMKKPFHSHCPECATQETELTTWDFLKDPANFHPG